MQPVKMLSMAQLFNFEDLWAHGKRFQTVWEEWEEALSRLLHDGGRVFVPLSIVHYQLLSLTDVEGEVIVLPLHCQVPDPLPAG
jgi:hypothetical protein